jgi:hypothetical protein
MTERQKQELWVKRIEDFRSSGQSQVAWCQEQDIPVHQLRYWLQKQRKNVSESVGSRWISMQATVASGSGVSLRLGAITLDIEPDFNQQVLVDVVNSLMTVC